MAELAAAQAGHQFAARLGGAARVLALDSASTDENFVEQPHHGLLQRRKPLLRRCDAVEFQAIASRRDALLQLPIERRLGATPEARIDVAEVAPRIGPEPCILDAATQEERGEFGSGKVLTHFHLDLALHVLRAFGQAIERNSGFVPTASFHVVHVVTERPQAQARAQLPAAFIERMGNNPGPLARTLGVDAGPRDPAEPLPVAKPAGLWVQGQPALLGFVVRRQRVFPGALVVKPVIARGIALQPVLRWSCADIADAI